jgi:DNA-binding GntR family transcriptional regulator
MHHEDTGPLIGLPWSGQERPRSLAERLAHAVAQRIVRGELEAGALLTEAELAAAHGVSRTPAREAMLQLERWGLVAIAPKKGASVTVPTARERRELLDLRSMLETHEVRRVAEDAEARAALASRLREVLARQREELGDPAAFAMQDYAFHAAIMHHGGSRAVEEIAGVFGPRLVRLTHLAVVSSAGRLQTFVDEHAALAEAVEAGDVVRFEALIDPHMASGHRGYEVAQ